MKNDVSRCHCLATVIIDGLSARTPPDNERFFVITFFAETLFYKKSWDSYQPRLEIAPLAQFRGPIARSGENSPPGPLPLGR